MDPSEFPTGKHPPPPQPPPPPPPRRELRLQGPRPSPLKVSKESFKIKKPPIATQPFPILESFQIFEPLSPPIATQPFQIFEPLSPPIATQLFQAFEPLPPPIAPQPFQAFEPLPPPIATQPFQAFQSLPPPIALQPFQLLPPSIPPKPFQPQPRPPLPPPQPPREPVIMYDRSPDLICTSTSDFKELVQKVTGMPSSSSSSSSSSSTSYLDYSGNVPFSSAADFATIEKANSPSEGKKSRKGKEVDVVEVEGLDIGGGSTVEMTAGLFPPGILSPLPSTLPPISPTFFSPIQFNSPVDPNSFDFLQDQSHMFQANTNYIAGTLVPSPTTTFFPSPPLTPTSPRTFLSSAPIHSPLPFLDIFNQFDFESYFNNTEKERERRGDGEKGRDDGET